VKLHAEDIEERSFQFISLTLDSLRLGDIPDDSLLFCWQHIAQALPIEMTSKLLFLQIQFVSVESPEEQALES